jgi:glycosyltransferase involved in cell wall biosynthesis
MRVGIDASNLRGGGGITHLVELLGVADPRDHGFSEILIWGGRATLERIADRPWLIKSSQPLLDRSLPFRVLWQRFSLSRLARAAKCDVLLVPGGSYAGDFHPVVTMSRNMLPFEWLELRRYGWSMTTARLALLRWAQANSFRRVDGLVFLTRYAHDKVMRIVKTTSGNVSIIPHGTDDRFVTPAREQLPVSKYSIDRPFRVLYVSIVDVYKHQWHVAEAIAKLRANGVPVALDLVGPAYHPALRRLRAAIERIDSAEEFISYSGPVPHVDLPARYRAADACVFASSCENMPNILLEGMTSGLPIACSNRGPMPEVLGDAGVYFDPENPDDIARAIGTLIDAPELRVRLAKLSAKRAQNFSWQRCARETFTFLEGIASARSAKPAAGTLP